MNLIRHILGWCGLLAISCVPVCAVPVLIGEFPLQGTLNNNVSGGPALGSLGGQISSTGYVFGVNQGLSFTSSALTPASYSVELSFSTNLDSTHAWSKLVDFAGQSRDEGLYIYHSGGYKLQFYSPATASVADFTTGATFDVILTRDGTSGLVTGYVNGQYRFSFSDTGNIGVVTAANNTLNFFIDDHFQNGEASSGTVNYIRIFNGALSAGEIAALTPPSAIPEPSTCAAVLGAAAFGFVWSHRRRGMRA